MAKKNEFKSAVDSLKREQMAQKSMMNPAVHRTYKDYKKRIGKGSVAMTYRQFVDYNYPNGAEGD